jgi:hypothetical protein
MAKAGLREWAVKGAEQRLVELAEEARTIFAAFPELRGPGREFDANRGDSVKVPVSPRKRRRRMSAAARKKVSLAQKRRWAEWRKKKGNAPTA